MVGMSQFSESKIRRDGSGQFAEKPPAPEAEGVDLAEPTMSEDARSIQSALVERGWSKDAATPDPDGSISVTHSATSRRGYETGGSSISMSKDEDGTWKVERDSYSVEHDYYAGPQYDGHTEPVASGLPRDEAVQRFADEVDEDNNLGEYDDIYPIYEQKETEPPIGSPGKSTWRNNDPWAQGGYEDPPF